MDEYFKLDGMTVKRGTFNLGPVSLQLDRGDYLVLLGPTGCGKTTLLKSIAGFYGKTPGKICIDGSDIGSLPPEKRRIGLVSQTNDLFPCMSVRHNIMFGMRYLNLDRNETGSRLRRYAKMLGIESILDRNISGLSGGEMKKASLARCLVLEPALLLLDEPLGMLDHNARRQVQDFLKFIKDERKTAVIHVTHDRAEAWENNGLTGVMNAGRILQTGTTCEVFRKPADRFVSEFLGCENVFRAVFKNKTAILGWTTLDLNFECRSDKGYVVIRPELIHPAKESNKTGITAVIISAEDKGDYFRVRAGIGSPGNAIIFHSTHEHSGKFHPGKRITLGWAKDSQHVIFEN